MESKIPFLPYVLEIKEVSNLCMYEMVLYHAHICSLKRVDLRK